MLAHYFIWKKCFWLLFCICRHIFMYFLYLLCKCWYNEIIYASIGNDCLKVLLHLKVVSIIPITVLFCCTIYNAKKFTKPARNTPATSKTRANNLAWYYIFMTFLSDMDVLPPFDQFPYKKLLPLGNSQFQNSWFPSHQKTVFDIWRLIRIMTFPWQRVEMKI